MKLLIFLGFQLTVLGKILKGFAVILELEVEFCPFKKYLIVVVIEIDGDVEIVDGLFFVLHGSAYNKNVRLDKSPEEKVLGNVFFWLCDSFYDVIEGLFVFVEVGVDQRADEEKIGVGVV